MPVNEWPNATEMIVMRVLQELPRGAFGLDIVHRSNGAVKRFTVYLLLARLEEKGFVRVLPKKPEPDYPGPPRPKYQLTAEGCRVIATAEAIGMSFAGA